MDNRKKVRQKEKEGAERRQEIFNGERKEKCGRLSEERMGKDIF